MLHATAFWHRTASVDGTLRHAGVSEQQLLAMGRHMLQLLSQHSQCLAALESHRPAEAKALAESALHQADCLPHPAKALGPQHIWRLRLSEALMRSCIDLGNCWLQALSVGQLLVPVYEMVYPKVCDTLLAQVVLLEMLLEHACLFCLVLYYSTARSCYSSSDMTAMLDNAVRDIRAGTVNCCTVCLLGSKTFLFGMRIQVDIS